MITHHVSTHGLGATEHSPERIREAIYAVESIQDKIKNTKAVMRGLPQIEIPVAHHFAHGTYGREIMIPKGTILTGKVHRFDDLNIVLSGECNVLTENGWKHCKAGDIFTGKAGTEQIGYALSDCRWITIHATDNQDLNTLEDELLYPDPLSPHDFPSGRLKSHLEFDLALSELGVDSEIVRTQSENDDDRLDVELEGCEVRPSAIHGLGVIATQTFKAGGHIGMSRIGGNRTQLGRFVNHCHNPNCSMLCLAGGIALVANHDIHSWDELTVDYRQAVREAIKCLV